MKENVKLWAVEMGKTLVFLAFLSLLCFFRPSLIHHTASQTYWVNQTSFLLYTALGILLACFFGYPLGEGEKKRFLCLFGLCAVFALWPLSFKGAFFLGFVLPISFLYYMQNGMWLVQIAFGLCLGVYLLNKGKKATETPPRFWRMVLAFALLCLLVLCRYDWFLHELELFFKHYSYQVGIFNLTFLVNSLGGLILGSMFCPRPLLKSQWLLLLFYTGYQGGGAYILSFAAPIFGRLPHVSSKAIYLYQLAFCFILAAACTAWRMSKAKGKEHKA